MYKKYSQCSQRQYLATMWHKVKTHFQRNPIANKKESVIQPKVMMDEGIAETDS